MARDLRGLLGGSKSRGLVILMANGRLEVAKRTGGNAPLLYRRDTVRVAFGIAFALVCGVLCGCNRPVRDEGLTRATSLRDRALSYLKAAVGYGPNPAVRVEAVEALEAAGGESARVWIRSALLDEHPAVRFAACVASGRLEDAAAERRLRLCVNDQDPSVQVAALFALHRLGITTGTGRIPTYLLQHPDPAVRRNAALILGLLGEPGAIRILARAMRDRDAGVRQHALEAMARLGSAEARQELTFMTNSGVGSEEVFALGALAETGDPEYAETFRYKLNSAAHLETRLSAARALGLLGSDEGLHVALDVLKNGFRTRHETQDSPAAQILRVRQLALAALGAIAHADALTTVADILDDPSDPRVQVSAAQATLQIIQAQPASTSPFVTAGLSEN